MAQSTSREGSQPKVGAQKPDAQHASADAADAAVKASARADADVVAMVSRDVNGDPKQSANYVVLVDDDEDDDVKDAAHNKAGEELGAKHVDHDEIKRDREAEESDRQKRLDTEAKELRAINKHSL